MQLRTIIIALAVAGYSLHPQAEDKVLRVMSADAVKKQQMEAEAKASKEKEAIAAANTGDNASAISDTNSGFFSFFSSEQEPHPAELSSSEAILVKGYEMADPDKALSKAKTKHEQGVVKNRPKQIEAPYAYFDLKPDTALSKRIYVDERTGLIHFNVLHGSLKNNFESLMSETRKTKHLIWKVGNHKVYSDYWVTGKSMFEIANNIVSPYNKPNQIMFGAFIGDTVGVFYADEKELWR